MTKDYASLSLADVAAEFDAIAADAQRVFGRLNERQLNWKPDQGRWSVAQCLDHLLSANREMFAALEAAADPSHPRTIWQRLPVLPRLFGPMMIKAQMPGAKRKFRAPAQALPASSAIDPQIVARFIGYQHEGAARVRGLDSRQADIVMVSPFVSFVTYTVLDGCRLIVTHERRHVEQARRMMETPGFPAD
jgi:hypothetical protein